MDLQLKGKVALVTGSTGGIGFSVAENLLKEGVMVYINGRTQERIDQAIKKLKSIVPNANVEGVVADFAKASDVQRLIKQIPFVDILINNVGIYAFKSFWDISDEEWMHYYEVNVMSAVRLSRHYLPLMLKKNWGRIMLLSSESAIQIPKEMIPYGMTKTALIAISRGLAELTKGTNVTANAILPGPTYSEGVERELKKFAEENKITTKEAEKTFFREFRPTSLLQRFAEDQEVANLITFIASPLSSATNGAPLRVDGGVVLSAF